MLATDTTLENSHLRLRDESCERMDLARRTEIKFVLTRADLPAIRKLLECRCRRIIYNDRVSTVQSIYFDDFQLSACHANLHGLSRRRKVRLRWYDSLLPHQSCVLEIKWRQNRTTGKQRLHLHSNVPIAKLSYPRITSWLARNAPHDFAAVLAHASEPTVLVRYRREHFVAPTGRLRVTLDYDVAYYDQTGKRFISICFPRRLADRVIVEVKGPSGLESQFSSALYPLSLRADRCSKYVEGCRLLGLVSANL